MSDVTANDIGLLLAYDLRRDRIVQQEAGFEALAVSPALEDMQIAYEEAQRAEAKQDESWLQAELARAAIDSHVSRLREIRAELESQPGNRQTLVDEANNLAMQVRTLQRALAL